MLYMRIRNQQRSEALDDARIFDDRGHRDVRSLNRINAGNADDAFEKSLQRRNIRLEVRQLLVKKHVFRRNHDLGCAFTGIDLYTFNNMFQRERAAHLRRRSAELAASAATTGYLDHAKSRTMPHDRNFFDGCLHLFWNL